MDAVKFTRQAFYGGDPDRYGLLTSTDKRFMLPYLEHIGSGSKSKGNASMGKAFIDSSLSTTRLTVQMADVGTTRMGELVTKLRAQTDSSARRIDTRWSLRAPASSSSRAAATW